MATQQIHASEASKMLLRSEVGGGKTKLPGTCFKSWQARKHAPKEFTPSLSDTAFRGRLVPAWRGKARAALFDFHELYFDNEWKTPLRFFIPATNTGRSATMDSDRTAGDCGEKTSLLLLAFSPFLGERATVCNEQRKMELWEKFENRSTKY